LAALRPARNRADRPGQARVHARGGLLREDGTRLIVTEAGMPLLDALLAELVPADLVPERG
jgi:oxygen-independent coproporphyrinogen-3 oxidase